MEADLEIEERFELDLNCLMVRLEEIRSTFEATGVLPFAPELNVEYDDLKTLCAATQHALNRKFFIGEPKPIVKASSAYKKREARRFRVFGMKKVSYLRSKRVFSAVRSHPSTICLGKLNAGGTPVHSLKTACKFFSTWV